MKTFLNKIQHLGISDETDQGLVQIIKLLNSITLVTIGFGILYFFISLGIAQYSMTYIVIINSILISGVFIFNNKKYYKTSRLYFLSLVNIGLALNCVFFGKESGIHFFYLVSASLPFIFFRNSELKLIVISVLMPTTFFVLIQFNAFPTNYIQHIDNLQLIFNMSMISSFVWTIINFYIVAQKNHKSMVEINDKNLEINNALDQKSILLQEVHHRVKNNLQIIISLLNLQSVKTEDEKTKQLLEESSNRIRSISSVHELLYSTKDFSNISAKTYIEHLIENIELSQLNKEVSTAINYHIEDVSLSLEKGIPLGLIINEIVTNSLKHAVVENAVNIDIQLNSNNNSIDVLIKDSGKGFDFESQLQNDHSLGLFLIKTIIEQIDGNLDTDISEKGTQYHIQFEK
ncbi:sensor histidine kinase [Paracrocinitomix mangrovi]|uniref:sensor histidine kinase n=1 Tax=Paracrocinitomix mangrovi TaxID=2862509 RepID=UPI001C8DED0D|nr:sensor histidine kinase [Paracrocinitomix mangrovi]UKN00335.1 sensor histidine kinase [Paracrocinitomix mangrovi]